MTTEEMFTNITQQNGMMITLLARLVWPPEKLVEIVMANKKKNPEAYVTVYNALDGEKTGKQLGEIAGVSQQAISFVLQGWLDDGIILNIGSDKQPKYRRLMRLPEKRKVKAKQEIQQAVPAGAEAELQVAQGAEETNGNGQ
jgi:hypothetical protein